MQIVDAYGNRVYPGGLPAAICTDGRVRTTIYPVKETARWSSARPPLQNISKRRESDYKKLVGDRYQYPIRSILRASKGHVLIESDYKGAELFGMAVLSGDPSLLEHVRRNQLPEDHEQYFDIHSYISTIAFDFDCPPTKAGLASIDKLYMRTVAKSVVFGCAYGRGAKAIALATREEGIDVSVDDAQKVVDSIFEAYPRLAPFFEECRRRAREERWMCGAFGRFRRFPMAADRKTQGDIERQAMNFPIQNMVADAINRAVDNVLVYRDTHADIDFKLALQIPDALLFEVPFMFVGRFIDEVLPACMVDAVPIYPTALDGTVIDETPHYMGVDSHAYQAWGVNLMPNQCVKLGFDPKYAGWHKTSRGYEHDEYSKHVWRDGQLVVKADLHTSA